MPTYEYRCPSGHDFEHFVLRMSEATATLPCPTCGKVAARRISAGAGFVFKGSGFYITDYGKDGKKDQRAPAAPAEAAATPAANGADSKAADARPAATESAPKPTTSGTTEA